jgi:hypothetical protein
MFFCKCKKQFKFKYGLLRHNNIYDCHNNIAIQKTNRKIKCIQCEKYFTTNSSLKRHVKAQHDKPDIELNNNFEEINNKVAKLILIVSEQNVELQQQLKATQYNNNETKTQNVFNINSIQQNIVVNFGSEDLSNFPIESIKRIFQKSNNCLLECIKQVHFNSNLPQFQNVSVTNLRDQFGYITINEERFASTKMEIANQLTNMSMKNISEWINVYNNNTQILEEKDKPDVLKVINDYNEDVNPLNSNNDFHKDRCNKRKRSVISTLYSKGEYNPINVLNNKAVSGCVMLDDIASHEIKHFLLQE